MTGKNWLAQIFEKITIFRWHFLGGQTRKCWKCRHLYTNPFL